ncbi:hypothetical protein AA102526_1763 [Asaia lannensis NBRC 102526]|nr:hypothetical protein AA102526_1763 [Asaia lannensis NBRC 102526]
MVAADVIPPVWVITAAGLNTANVFMVGCNDNLPSSRPVLTEAPDEEAGAT